MADLTQSSDQELTALLSAGSELAFAEIYNRYNVRLFLYAYKKLDNQEEAKDIVQEVFTRLWRKRMEYSINISLNSYLHTAIRNCAFDLFAHKKIAYRYIASLQNFLDQETTFTDDLVREKEIGGKIEKEIAALPPRMREVFELSRKDHLSHRAIAEKLQISESTVSGQIKKALRILRVRLGLFVSIFLYLYL